MTSTYRGRLAPSPTGYLHLGHARTFHLAWQRARQAGGRLVLRIEDIDTARCRPEFVQAAEADLRWLGLEWDEGPFFQSERRAVYFDVLERLWRGGHLYPCRCSRRDVLTALSAPHAGDEEPHYPGTCRPREPLQAGQGSFREVFEARRDWHWRFRVPEGERLRFHDETLGPQEAVAGRDFGDFVVWRRDDVPAYQLAVVADDLAMAITEVVRGADLLLSTFRQLLLYRALGRAAPRFCHAPLIIDPATGQRLAKRHASLSLRHLRAAGATPARILGSGGE